MKVPDILKALAVGELSNLYMGNTGVIDQSKIPAVIQAINDALLQLYTKFALKEESLILELRVGVTNYHFKKRFAYSEYDLNNPPASWDMPYILDMDTDKFEEDVIKVLTVYGYDGTKLLLNDVENTQSVFTPQPQMLEVPYPIQGKCLSVVYQAKHKTVPSTEYEDFEVEFPDCLFLALRYAVAAQIYSQMNTQENIMKGQEYEAKYLAQCQTAIDMDLVNTTISTTNTRFEKRGWV